MKATNAATFTPLTSEEDIIDCSDLLGVDTVFPATADPVRQQQLVNAFCNKIGTETGPA
jgi:hypothetical protein